MAKTIPLDAIDASDRLRPVSEAHAQALAVSIGARGLFNRISVRATPNGAKKWKLVLGAHRLRGMEIAGFDRLVEGEHFTILKIDADEARLMEAEENLARNDLTKLERALTVLACRQAWERKFGRVERGGDQSAKLGTLLEAGEQVRGFSEWAADRLGISERSVKRLGQIATGLKPALAAQLFALPYADNQHVLEGLARLAPAKQMVVADWIASGKDPEQIINEALNGKAKEATMPVEKAFNAVVGNWRRIPAPAKWRVLDHIGVSAILTEEQKARLAEKFGED